MVRGQTREEPVVVVALDLVGAVQRLVGGRVADRGIVVGQRPGGLLRDELLVDPALFRRLAGLGIGRVGNRGRRATPRAESHQADGGNDDDPTMLRHPGHPCPCPAVVRKKTIAQPDNMPQVLVHAGFVAQQVAKVMVQQARRTSPRLRGSESPSRRQTCPSGSAIWAITRNVPALTDATCFLPSRHWAQSTPPSSCPNATRPASGPRAPHSTHASSEGRCPRIRSAPSSNRKVQPAHRFAGRQRL